MQVGQIAPEIDPLPIPYNCGMESDQLNQIENSLQDLAARSAELRRYL